MFAGVGNGPSANESVGGVCDADATRSHRRTLRPESKGVAGGVAQFGGGSWSLDRFFASTDNDSGEPESSAG